MEQILKEFIYLAPIVISEFLCKQEIGLTITWLTQNLAIPLKLSGVKQ
jgi:hypothetical protein